MRNQKACWLKALGSIKIPKGPTQLKKGEPMSPSEIKKRLEQAYPKGLVDVTDLTGGEDHYSVYVASNQFAGLSRIQRHKHVMAVFAEELKTGEVHALSIRTEVKESL